MSVLALTVYVTDTDGEVHQCLAGTSPRAELAELIRNPAAWETPYVAGSADSTEDADFPAASSDAPPPRGGPGGSRLAWITYAHSQGLEVDHDLTRDSIIDACRQAGIEV